MRKFIKDLYEVGGNGSSGPQFFQTALGRRFFEGQVPRLLKELDSLNKNLSENQKTFWLAEVREALSEAVCANESLCMDSEEDRETLMNNLMEKLNGCGYITTPTKKESQS
tara:strand:+ start:7928 stop:8260 length:333 start_codon:yes stop_codon:yes gene_type:complete